MTLFRMGMMDDQQVRIQLLDPGGGDFYRFSAFHQGSFFEIPEIFE